MAAPDYSTAPWIPRGSPPNPAEAFIGGLGHGVQIGRDRARQAQEAALANARMVMEQRREEGQSQDLQERIASQERQTQARIGQQFEAMNARVAMEQKRLQQQRETEQLKATLQEQRLKQQAEIAAQRIRVTAAYHDQMTDIRAGQLNAVQQRIDLAAKQAADKFAAQQAYQAELKQIDALENLGDIGAPEAQQMREEAFMRNAPGMGQHVGALAAARARQGFAGPQSRMVDGKKFYQVSPNRWEVDKESKEPATVYSGSLGPGMGTLRGPLNNANVRAMYDRDKTLAAEKEAKRKARGSGNSLWQKGKNLLEHALGWDENAPETPTIEGLKMPEDQGGIPAEGDTPTETPPASTPDQASAAPASAPATNAPTKAAKVWNPVTKRIELRPQAAPPMTDEEYLQAMQDNPEEDITGGSEDTGDEEQLVDENGDPIDEDGNPL